MAVALVQARSLVTNGTGSTSHALAYSSNVTSGNLLVICAGTDTTGSTITIADTVGSTWTSIISSNPGTDFKMQSFYATAAGSGANTVTATYSGSSLYRRLTITEYSGLDATLTGTAVADATTGTSLTGSNLVTGSTACIIAHMGTNSSSSTLTAGANYTIPTGGQANGAGTIGQEDRQGAAGAGVAAGTYTASYTCSNSVGLGLHTFAFVLTSGAPPPAAKNLAALGVG